MEIDEKIMKDIKELALNLYKIQCRNWILSKGNGFNAAGITLEKLLGKNEDKYILPDYHGIELKARSKFNTYPLNLFSCALDSRPLEMYRLLKIGGYPDKRYPELRVFQICVNAVDNKKVGIYSYILFVNREKEVLELRIMYSDTLKLYTTMSWSFRELKSRLEHKLSYLAIVNVIRERACGNVYFKYYDYTFYKLKGFDEFLYLIEKGSICVSFRITYNHSEAHFGEYEDKGTGFEIVYEDIPLLFDKIEVEH